MVSQDGRRRGGAYRERASSLPKKSTYQDVDVGPRVLVPWMDTLSIPSGQPLGTPDRVPLRIAHEVCWVEVLALGETTAKTFHLRDGLVRAQVISAMIPLVEEQPEFEARIDVSDLDPVLLRQTGCLVQRSMGFGCFDVDDAPDLVVLPALLSTPAMWGVPMFQGGVDQTVRFPVPTTDLDTHVREAVLLLHAVEVGRPTVGVLTEDEVPTSGVPRPNPFRAKVFSALRVLQCHPRKLSHD